jgi:hypothetical protein
MSKVIPLNDIPEMIIESATPTRKNSLKPTPTPARASDEKYLLSPARNNSRDIEALRTSSVNEKVDKRIALELEEIASESDSNIQIQHETFEQILSYKSCIQLIMNFLNENPNASDDPIIVKKFESLTKEFVARFSVNSLSRLDDLLRQNGWNGTRYSKSLDSSMLYVELLTLYSNYNVEISKYNISNKGNLIKSFCPTLLLEDLMELSKNKESLTAWKHDFQGVCMLADISGFTKLAAAYSAEGNAGLDKLHDTTTFFLGQFVEQVYSFEGDG